MEASKVKNILITGCNKGVGFGILKNLAARPEKHRFIMAVRSSARGKEALAEIEKTIPKISERTKILELELADTASIDKFVKEIKETKEKIDCLVNNAGMAFKGDIFNEEVVRVTFQTNFYGTIDFTEKMMPYLNPSAKIIFVTSSAGKLDKAKNEALRKEFDDPAITKEKVYALAKKFYDNVVAGTWEKDGWAKSAYGVSKLCLNIFTRVLSKHADIIKNDIQVYSCCPGWVRTDMAGPKAPRSIEEGALCPCDLVNFPYHIDPTLQGKFFYDGKVTPL